jgi:hypothetical protein
MTQERSKYRRLPQVHFTDEQQAALDKAIENYRRRTGKNITWADIARTKGAAVFCAENGMEWPKESK